MPNTGLSHADILAKSIGNCSSSSEGRARAREEAEGIDGSALESPILSTGELAGPVSVTTKNGTKVDIFSRSSDQGQNALFAALSFSDGTQQEFELRHNTVFSEDENGNMFMFVNDDDELLGSEGDDIIINLSAGRVSANGGNDTVLNLYNNVESVEGGSGDDTIYAGNLNRASVNGGQGNDTFVASYTSSSSSIDMGDGDDTVQVRNLESSVNLGNGHNTLRAATFGTGSLGDKKEFTISGGDGNDVISIGAMGSVGGRHNIDVGEGDNTLNIKSIGFSSATQIRAGNGNNTVAVDSMEARNRPGAGDVLSLGNGNNNVHIGSLSGFTSMTLGNGNNTMSIDKMSESLVVGMEIDGKYMVSRMAYEFVFGDGNNDFNVTKLLQSRVRFGNGANTITGDSIEHSIISASDTSIYEKPKQHGRIEYPV